ncbi:MAG TPA: PEPxxWA-CTERM sorting domain-containing protein [Sphingomonadaceae bacterium]|jgi:hypothetical protein|nr:PEPxxWA-CTERM sorting domain-containing protein [Sphingomonadaceae bacterium]
MRKIAIGLLAATAAIVATPALAAVTLTSVAVTDANYSNPDNFTYTFDSRPAGLTGGKIVPGEVGPNGNHAQPFGGAGGYFSVGPSDGSPATFNLGPVSQISFLWGSVDGNAGYNVLTLLGTSDPSNGGAAYTYDGVDILNPANGFQGSGGTALVTLTFSGDDATNFTGLQFNANQNAFEIDSMNVAAVPEPATWAMMIGGFGLIGLSMRRRSRTRVAVSIA